MSLVLYKQTVEEYLSEVRHRGNPNYVNVNGIPALSEAIYKFRSAHLVEELIKDGANVNTFTSIDAIHQDINCVRWNRVWGNFSPLHVALACGKLEIVRMLLDNGADFNAKTSKGIEPLEILLGTCIRCLKKVEEEEIVSKEEDLEILKLILHRGSDIHFRNRRSNDTLLHYAILEEKPEMASLLILAGCNVNDVNEHGTTPLHNIKRNHSIECARILLENNANPNAQDCAGRTVCHNIVFNVSRTTHGDETHQLIRLLHNYDANLNIPDNEGRTVLHFCIRDLQGKTRAEFTELILELGGDPSVADEHGRTAAFYLISTTISEPGHWEVIFHMFTKLLQYGMIFNKKDIIGEPLLHVVVNSCMYYSNASCFKRFIDCTAVNQGIDVNIADVQHRTALHLVSAEGRFDFAEILLKHGADVNAKDCDGSTPLHTAIECKRWQFAKQLFELPCTIDASLTGRSRNSFLGKKPGMCRLRRAISEYKHSELFPPLGSDAQWTPKTLSTIEKHSGYGYYARVRRTVRAREYFDVQSYLPLPEPTISKEFFDCINTTFLLQACEENSLGYFHHTEKCAEERCLIFKQVFRLVNDLVTKCAEMDPKMESKILWSGSTAEGTKMWEPDEFDFVMELTKLKDRCNLRGVLHSPEVAVTKDAQLQWSDLCNENDGNFRLSPMKIKCYVTTLLWLAGFSLDRSRYPNISFKLCQYRAKKEYFIQQTNVGVMLTFYWRGEKYKKLLINVDLTPAIPLQVPDKCKSEFRQHAVSNWNYRDCHVVPHMSSKNQYSDMWRMSFTLAELQLMYSISAKQVRLYKCLKFLRDIYKVDVADVPSYHLKCFVSEYIFSDEYVDTDSFCFNVCDALRQLRFRFDTEQHCYVKHIFLVQKRLSLSSFDMRWCSIAYRHLLKSL